MYPRAYQFSRNKSCRTYFITKSGRCTKRFGPKVLHSKLKHLDNYKPMNIECLKYLAKLLRRRINIYSKEHVSCTFGKGFAKPSIDVMYASKYSETVNGNVIDVGHFALKNGRDASSDNGSPNNCLLRVISAQTGIRSRKLRREIKRQVRKTRSPCHLRNFMYGSEMPVLMNVDIVGGARYDGSSSRDAKRILDRSQKGQSHPDMKAGHPRGHASYPQATGPTDSVENYSRTNLSDKRGKTGFFSRSDQDLVAHFALSHGDCQDALELLNEKGKDGKVIDAKIPATRLRIDESELPKVQNWYNGEKIGDPGRINTVVVVMKHYYQKYDDENADVFILTLYPKL